MMCAARNTLLIGDCLKVVDGWPDDCVDLVFGSPPYPEKGERYGGRSKRWPSLEWAHWMLEVTQRCIRACRGPVLWVVNGSAKGGYNPACERLMVLAADQGIQVERPVIWHKNAPPNRHDWFGNDWEYILAFRKGPIPHWDWEAIGTPPAYKSGGRFRQRNSKGERVLGSEYPQNKVTRPRDVLRVTVGGGHLGSPLAHQNEAPFPEKLVEPFVKALCPRGGIVLDPFCGSGTTCAVAAKLGRDYIGIDIREDQIALSQKRLDQEVFA